MMDLSAMTAFVHNLLAQTTPADVPQGLTGEDIKIIGACFCAALVMGVAALGPGISEGFAAAKAVEGVARNPEAAGSITRTMIIGQAVTESVAIYCLLIALVILFIII
ncbi:MAG: ATP synthase subunit c [Candidatus Hydrogenedentes bacterium ADurb.Bin101]|nr:MAG: ATP synthase subunit c [Candidatus Hydrogenedentes bacterium ADurb.Bin101]